MQSLADLRAIDSAVLTMERNGVFVDVDFCNRTAAIAATDEAMAWDSLRSWVKSGGMEPADVLGVPLLYRKEDVRTGESGPRLQEFLHTRLGLPPSPFWKKGRVKDGEIKTDAAALEYLAGQHPEHRVPLHNVLGLRKARGCLKYLRKLPLFVVPATGRVHPVYGPASDSDERVGALTGRFAVKRPEFQQIPRDPGKDKYGIRKAFRAQKPGHVLLAADQSALEVVILAHIVAVLFDDTTMPLAVAKKAPDIHSVHAIRVFRDVLGYREEFAGIDEWMAIHKSIKKFPNDFVKWCRDAIKTIWYGLQYGKGAWGFGSTIFDAQGNPLGDERAQVMIDGLLDFRKPVRDFRDWVPEFILQHRGISSLSGRWCDLRELLDRAEAEANQSWRKKNIRDTWAFKRAERRADNYPMQAGGADIMGIAIALAANSPVLARAGFFLIGQIHDELLLEGPGENADEAQAELIDILENAWPLRAQLQATGHYGPTWADCKG